MMVCLVSMDSMSLMSSPNVCSLTTGGNLWLSKHSTKNTSYASFIAPKASMNQRKIQKEYNLSRFQQPCIFKSVEGGFIYKENYKKYIPKAIPKESFASVKHFFVTLYWFCYPYTLFGRTLSTISASLLAVDRLSDISPLFFIGILQILLPFTLFDLYVNGVNQLYDLEIDKINKPFLPLPSGAFSFKTGVIVTASSAILGFFTSYLIGSWPLFWGLLFFFLVWSGYSIKGPLLRWKKNPVLAAICIFFTMTLIFPLSFFYHMKTFVLKRAAVFPKPLMFSVAFMSIYSLAISLFKDIPDIEGDKAFGIESFSTRLGQKRVFWICVSILESAFGVAFLAGLSSPFLWVKIVTGVGNAVLGSILWYRAKFVNLNDRASIRSYYMLIWKLLYVSYILLPLIR
ncbi:glycinol 4-dimethylallyltransferase-like isoform X1 [Vigna angularis]|uniref:glycinol 4-dimethylallyltransferase-like isoform X1 n=1 Tax=Phaseolus angularis TaxID=3914 RepID=UPI0022B3D7A2|nr:glycinol 4-dimethylallyltransferase-like isoform X1 [Vigna angularis]